MHPRCTQEVPKSAQEAPKRRPRGSKLSPKGAQEGPKSFQKAVQEHLESTRGNLLNLRSRLHGSVILRGRGALERHLNAKLKHTMASKSGRTAQLGAQVRLGSPTWQYKSNLEPNRAPKWDF